MKRVFPYILMALSVIVMSVAILGEVVGVPNWALWMVIVIGSLTLGTYAVVIIRK